MKKIIYGAVDSGKEATYIAPLLRDRKNVVIVSKIELESALQFMRAY